MKPLPESPGRSASDVCAQCAKEGGCCCLLTPGQEELCFPVSEMERRRIMEHGEHGDHGPTLGELASAPNAPAFLGHLARLFPKDRALLEELFPPQGTHLRLATRPDGGCTFLTAAGCSLPREARPYYCRLFPFWVSAGSVAAFVAEGCIAARQGRTVSGMLAALDVTAEEVRELHARMRMAWGLTPQDDRNRSADVPPKLDTNA